VSEDLRSNHEILFIDDSRTAVALASKMLGEKYIVHSASNGEEAWNIIENNPALTIVFTDMHMPVMNGMELLIKIRRADNPRIAKLPVIMVTGKTDTEAGRRAVFDIGATDFIGKPFTALDLLLRVRAHTVQPTQRTTANKELGGNLEMLVSPSVFHSLGCQALEYAYEKRTEFTVVFIELSNYADLKEEVGDKNVKQMIIAIAVRLSNIIREEDVATRIGENKFAVLLFTENKYANSSAETLYKNLKKQEFLFNDRVIIPILTYGQANIDVTDKKITFQEMCVSADQSLQKASSSLPVNDTAAPRFPARKYSNKDLDLWAAIKYVIDGEYDLVPEKHKEMLVKCMESYLAHIAPKH
jgi:diguanylate cyclase (GGDEF)-like protein